MQPTQSSIEIFCSYAAADASLYHKLEKHLHMLSLPERRVTVWHRHQITAGIEQAKVIDAHLQTASVILLLLSPDFFAPDSGCGIEMQHAMQRHDAGQARVIPILLRPVAWKGTPIGKLTALPSNGAFLKEEKHQDKALMNVAQGILAVLNESPREVENIIQQPPRRNSRIVPQNQPRLHEKLVAIAITLVLVSLAVLVGNQVFHPLQDARSSNVTSAPPGVTITFDALGGSSNVIEVYPGAGNTLQDKTYNGTYDSGDTVPIVCETKGRVVTSNPAAGEQYRQSDEWYKLQTPPGTQPEYVTAVYADKHGSAPQC